MTWTIDAWADRVTIYSPDIPQDAGLELVGDFGSERARMAFAEFICMALNHQAKAPKRLAETAEAC